MTNQLPSRTGSVAARIIATAIACVTLLVANTTLGQDKQRCADAFTKNQLMRREGRWVEAREELLVCAAATCPNVVSVKCIEWLDEVERDIPTVTVRVTEGGADIADAQVWIDGTKKADRIDGQPIALDPGEHTVEVRRGADTRNQTIVLAARDKARPVVISLAANATPRPDGGTASIHPLVFAGYGVALAGVIVGSITGGLSLSQAADIDERCVNSLCPENTQADIEDGKLLAHVSTTSFIVAGVGAVLGTVGIFLSGNDDHTALLVGPSHLGLRTRF